MDGEKPSGGAWNFDKENRLTPPKGYKFPDYLTHEKDELDLKVEAELANSNLNHILHRLCGPPSIPLSFNLVS